MLGNGIAQKDIPGILECSKAHVSRTKSQAIKDGYLNDDCTFTTKGKERYGSIDIDRYFE